jgi:hypothetical protein
LGWQKNWWNFIFSVKLGDGRKTEAKLFFLSKN